jgi:hypothetical protein
MTDKPVISDAEAVFVLKAFDIYVNSLHVEAAKFALSAFLLARVPDAKPVGFHKQGMGPLLSGGEWNACRGMILRGKE